MSDSQKLLVVEDEEYLRDLYVQILTQAGFIVDTAVNGEDAYHLLKENEYHLVLLDIILPKMDGLQVLDRLEKDGKSTHENVVLLTNLGQDLVVAKALAYGVRGYMVKSDYTPDELVKEVKGYLNDEHVKSKI
ncbi:response regulator [Candidatus Woesebacteria bacterium]|nr:response regulator [Candidatus Woesebacteria bacterium]